MNPEKANELLQFATANYKDGEPSVRKGVNYGLAFAILSIAGLVGFEIGEIELDWMLVALNFLGPFVASWAIRKGVFSPETVDRLRVYFENRGK